MLLASSFCGDSHLLIKRLKYVYIIQTESRHMKYQMNKTNFLISLSRAEFELLPSTTLSWALSRSRLFILLSMLEIWKFILFIWYSMCRDSVCIRGVELEFWPIPDLMLYGCMTVLPSKSSKVTSNATETGCMQL